MNTIRTLDITFDQPISIEEMEYFRGAIVEKVGIHRSWYHNHDNDPDSELRFHYRYPLIQYCRRRGQPGILFINEAVAEAQYLLTQPDWSLSFATREYTGRLSDLRTGQQEMVSLGDIFREYRLGRWLALNEENYARYQALSNLKLRIELLERILAAQILSLATGVNVRLVERFNVELTAIKYTQTVIYKGTPLLLFGIQFKTNLALPIGLGLGKGVALGYGRISQYRSATEKRNQDTQRQLSFHV